MSWVFDEEVLAVLAAIVVVAGVFAVSQIFYAGRVTEPFSELGLLGPSGKIGDYPREVVAGSPFQLNLYVGNHEGKAMYYKVLVKVGDKSSIINASTPLDSKPIMRISVVLGHNSSRIIPLNITLYKPATNIRLVFEMWVYDESAGAFEYHGRWNQLWMNVTETIVPVSPKQQNATLSSDMEDRVAEAYMAVRRAESAGGDVSGMIDLVNAAIESAVSGDLEKAERCLNMVFSLEPEVTQAGIKASRDRLYTAVVGLATVVSVCVGLYAYLRSNLWLLWAKLHRDWIVIWDNAKVKRKRNKSKKRNRAATKSKGGDRLTVWELVNGSKAADSNPRVAARELYRRVRVGEAKLLDPNPPRTFSSYLFSRYNAGFITASVILAFGIICIYLSNLSTAILFARYVFGSIIVLFLPGYSLIEALYPDEKDLSPLERLALSIGLSLAIVPLVGLVLNYTPWGIRLNPIIVATTTLITLLLLVSAYRKFSLLKLKVLANGSLS